ncbi:MAG: hypothetical protein ACPL7B_10655 [Candidatus Poribacteria bacterium]
MGFKQIIGIIGSILLILGVFIPLVKIPIVGGISFYDNSKLEAIIVIIIAVISIFLVVAKRYILLWFSGFALLAVVLVRGIQVIRKLYSARSTAEKILGERLTAKLTKKLTNIAIEHVDISWGLIFLIVGAILIILCALLATKKRNQVKEPEKQ